MAKNNKSLKSMLFLAPTLIFLISFSIILFAFDMAINRYTTSRVYEKIDEEFKEYDFFYDEDNADHIVPSSVDEYEFIIPIHSFLIDENNKLLFPDNQWTLQNEYYVAKEVRDYIVEKNINLNDGKIKKITVGDNTYMVQSKKYVGKYDGIFVIKSNMENKDYMLVAYAEITPMQDFVKFLTKILIIVTVISATIGVFAIFIVIRSIDKSLSNVKKYIIGVGKRKKVSVNSDVVHYKEFEEVIETVENMSNMIDESEMIQKKFFQNASHELRTPLMSIQGYAEGLQLGVFKDKDKSLNIIVNEVNKMSELVNQMLQLSKLDDYEMKREVVDLSFEINNCIDSVRSIAVKNNISIDVFPIGNLKILGDEKQLESAFLNILINAVKYAKSKITVTMKKEMENSIIVISDDGIGINEKDIGHIFERFYKGENGNFGIGLAISKEVIERHDGTISVFSKEGEGTTFEIKIPMLTN